MKDIEKKIKIEEVANKVKLLLEFASYLIPDKEMILEAGNSAGERESFAGAAAPIFGAVGLDYRETEVEMGLLRKRAEAIYNLVDVLESTEKERVEFRESQKELEKQRNILRGILG